MSQRVTRPATASFTPAVALGTVVLVEVLRAWLPSIAFIFGRAGSTPATTLGAFALLWFVLGLVIAPFTGRVGPRRLFLVGGAGLALGRLALQLTDGGDAQLWASCLALLAGIAWLIGLAGAPERQADRRAIAIGLVAGLLGVVAVHGALGSVDLVWRDGVAAWVAVFALVGAFGVAGLRAAAPEGWPASGRPDTEVRGDVTPGAGWPWLGIGLALVLHGVLAGVPSRVVVAVDWPAWLATAVLVAAHAAGLAAGLAAVGRASPEDDDHAAPETRNDALSRPLTAALTAAAAIVVGTVLAAGARSLEGVAGQVLLALGIGVAVPLLLSVEGRSTPVRRGLAAAGGMLLFFLFGFLYYAGYDIVLPVSGATLLATAAVVLAGLTVLAGTRPLSVTPLAPVAHPAPVGQRAITATTAVVAAAVFVVVAAVGAALAVPGPLATTAGGAARSADLVSGVRVMVYNLHMGFDSAGRYDAAALAAVIAEQDPDVVVLNEVDRGWLLNGSHDLLPDVAQRLGMAAVFAPASDEVWGNAILSRLPISDVRRAFLPQGRVPMRRSVVSAVITLDDGERLGVVGTHLHHVDGEGPVRLPQAEQVAEVAAGMAGEGMPVVVMGDMNAQPGEPELAPFTVGLVDAVAPLGTIATYPSWAPEAQIDHIFTTPDVVSGDLAVPQSEASDHLGIALTLTRSG